jgi:antirestriction protein ArdC
MPDFARFTTAVGYYSTLGHEHVHYTGHPSRLNRDFSGRFGEEAYAFEELVAELGAVFLAAELGLTVEPREDHAVYIHGWLHCLKHDPRAIFTASSKAQAAVNWMKEKQSMA